MPPQAAAASALAGMRRPEELALLGGLLAAYWLVDVLGARGLHQPMNLAGPAALTTILGWSCYRIVRRSPIAIWAPLFWFRLACAAYFGFGALVPHIVNDETRDAIFSLYYFDDALNFKVNFIYATGIFLTLAFSFLFLKRLQKAAPATGTQGRSPRALFLFAVCFLLVGAILRYGFVVPYSLGLTQTVLPGMLDTLSKMYYAGIYLLISYAVAYNRKILPIVLVLVVLDILVSVASFAKTELVFILVFSFLGFISRDTGRRNLLVGAVCVTLAFFAFQPLVGYGRERIAMGYGSIQGASLDERWEIVRQYLDGGRDASVTRVDWGLLRLSYLNANAFVVDAYDTGVPGDTLRNAAAVIIPRLLWPDKPIIASLGAELYVMIVGRRGTSLGIGHFAEAYWNFGWSGMAPFMAILAFILSAFTKVSVRIMAREDWLFLPVVFVGVNVGLRVDGHAVSDILGAAWMAICLWLALAVVNAVLVAPAPQRRASSARHLLRSA